MPNSAFETYFATVYDQIYHDKDYESEVEQLLERFDSWGYNPGRILDIGCGSGSHAIHLAERGFDVTGIEPSKTMATHAREKVRDEGLEDKVSVEQSTIEEYRPRSTFDAAVAQFNVWGYLTTNETLSHAFESVKASLSDGSPFVFDTWYGPAVLNIEPDARLKKVQTEDGVLYRYATPTMHTERNVVDVEYDVLHVKEENLVERGNEVHSLRYFFRPEIESFCEQAGLELRSTSPVDNEDGEIGPETWNVMWLAEA